MCIQTLAEPPSTVLTRDGTSEHFLLVPDIRVKVSSLSPQSVMFAMGLLWMTCVRVREFPFLSSLLRFFFFHERVLDFVKCTSCAYVHGDAHVVFVP